MKALELVVDSVAGVVAGVVVVVDVVPGVVVVVDVVDVDVNTFYDLAKSRMSLKRGQHHLLKMCQVMLMYFFIFVR